MSPETPGVKTDSAHRGNRGQSADPLRVRNVRKDLCVDLVVGSRGMCVCKIHRVMYLRFAQLMCISFPHKFEAGIFLLLPNKSGFISQIMGSTQGHLEKD